MKLANRYDLSFVLVGLNPSKWAETYDNIANNVKNYTFELIIVSPNLPKQDLQDKLNVKFIRDFGHPSRCLQLGTMIAVGEYLTWGSEDYRMEKDGIGECIDLIKTKRSIDMINMLYSEGPNFTGDQHLNPYYFYPHYHAALRYQSINPQWTTALCVLMKTDLFRYMGGIDCRYEHFNMNVHDLLFRIQNAGGVVYRSTSKVYSHDHNPNAYEGNHFYLQKGYEENDEPLFRQKYSQQAPDFSPINYLNWMEQTNIWERKKEKYNL